MPPVKDKNRKCAIYKITNLVTGDFYIGLSVNPKRRFRSHFTYAARGLESCRILYSAIRKYGKDNFSCEIVDWANSVPEAGMLEQKYISELSPAYNLTAGGDGAIIVSEETREKHRVAMIGNQHAKGHSHPTVHTEETKQLMSQLAKQRGPVSDAAREAMRQGQLGRRHKPETIEKIRQANLNKVISDDTKKKMSDAQINSKYKHERDPETGRWL